MKSKDGVCFYQTQYMHISNKLHVYGCKSVLLREVLPSKHYTCTIHVSSLWRTVADHAENKGPLDHIAPLILKPFLQENHWADL